MTATNAAWRKWQPQHPTSPHWYTPERLRALLAAYVAADRESGRGRTVREVVAEFAGLSGTAKQKAVTDAAGLTGARLEDLIVDGDLNPDQVAALLRAMQEASRPIKPAALGVLGEAHVRARVVADWGAAPDSVRYAKQLAMTARGVPFVTEMAFAVRDHGPRVILAGVNFSPVLNPATLHLVMRLVGNKRVDPCDPVVLLVHIASPCVAFADRGKTVLALEADESEDTAE